MSLFIFHVALLKRAAGYLCSKTMAVLHSIWTRRNLVKNCKNKNKTKKTLKLPIPVMANNFNVKEELHLVDNVCFNSIEKDSELV